MLGIRLALGRGQTTPPPESCNPNWDEMVYASHFDDNSLDLSSTNTLVNDRDSIIDYSRAKFGISSFRVLATTNESPQIRVDPDTTISSVSFWLMIDTSEDKNILSMIGGPVEIVIKGGKYGLWDGTSSTPDGLVDAVAGVWVFVEILTPSIQNVKAYVNGELIGDQHLGSPLKSTIVIGGFNSGLILSPFNIDDMQVRGGQYAPIRLDIPTEPFAGTQCLEEYTLVSSLYPIFEQESIGCQNDSIDFRLLDGIVETLTASQAAISSLEVTSVILRKSFEEPALIASQAAISSVEITFINTIEESYEEPALTASQAAINNLSVATVAIRKENKEPSVSASMVGISNITLTTP